jgi:hypothetical protein
MTFDLNEYLSRSSPLLTRLLSALSPTSSTNLIYDWSEIGSERTLSVRELAVRQ